MPTRGWRKEVSEVGCRKARWLLALYDSGELNSEQKEEVEAHLASCQRCRQELARLSKVPALLQSLQGDTWWADVSSPVRERLNAHRARSSPPQAKPIETGKRSIVKGRPVWQPVLISLVAAIIIVGASLGVIQPWEGDNLAQAAAEAVRNDPQVQAILGGGSMEVTEVEIAGPTAYVYASLGELTVEAQVDVASLNVKTILCATCSSFGPSVYRSELTEDEQAKAIEIAEADPCVQKILSHGLTLGEPSNSSPVLGVDPRRVAWLPFEGDAATDEVRGVIVNLDDQDDPDITVMWGGDLPSWWPY
jgi:anti-sigma factor RsiW